MKQYWIPTLTLTLLTASVGTWAHMTHGQDGAKHHGPMAQGMQGQGMQGHGMQGHGMHAQGMHAQGMHAQGMSHQGMSPQGMMGHPMQMPLMAADHMKRMSTPEMRALQDEMHSKMQAAKTPEERQALMTQHREKMRGLMNVPGAPATR